MFNGFKLLLNPGRYWQAAIDSAPRTPLGTLGAAFEAATVAAVAVVAGQLGSALYGLESNDVAIQRAAVGLLATFMGAVVMAPALSLVLIAVSRNAQAPMNSRNALACAMGFIWPAWFAGVVMIVPPLVGMGPEPGELCWILLAGFSTVRILRSSALQSMQIRRRWRFTFMWQAFLAFMILFIAVPVVPALISRSFLQVDSDISFGAPEEILWPIPPTADW